MHSDCPTLENVRRILSSSILHRACFQGLKIAYEIGLSDGENHIFVLGVPAPWSLGGSPVTSSTLRLGVERRRHLCAGDVETPILCGEAP